MNRMLFVVPAIAACSALLWAAPQVAPQQAIEDAPSKTEAKVPVKIASIGLTETLNAWGGGEAFDLTLRSDGTATWNKHGMTFKGAVVAETWNGEVSEKRFDTFSTMLRDAQFFSLKPRYDSPKTDQETTTLSVTGDEKTWRVASYSDGAPPAFFKIVQALKEERDAIQWTKVEGKEKAEGDTTTETAETKSAETKSAETKSAETKSAETKSAETEMPVKAGAAAMCEIHHVALEPDTLPISYGSPGPFTFEVMKAGRKSFPHAATQVLGGCVISDNSPKTTTVAFCPQCRLSEAQWIKSHQKK